MGNYNKQYQKKLIKFNETEKYKQEMKFMHKLIEPKLNDKILDYGCGTGYMVNYLNTHKTGEYFGYDINPLLTIEDEYTFRDSFHFKFDHVYFMHSIAHLPNPESHLKNVKENFLKEKGKIHIITPNLDWLNAVGGKNYKPDKTVIKHFDLQQLGTLFWLCKFSPIQIGQFGSLVYYGESFINERIFLST